MTLDGELISLSRLINSPKAVITAARCGGRVLRVLDMSWQRGGIWSDQGVTIPRGVLAELSRKTVWWSMPKLRARMAVRDEVRWDRMEQDGME